MIVPPLSHSLTQIALAHLGVEAKPPTAALLAELITAYTRSVPWESASRIAKRATMEETSGCPRWPNEFWTGARDHGTGGTCYESNYAFFALLRALGYDGYLTVNDMHASVGCHTAIVVQLDGRKWLVDVGMPLHTPVPFDLSGGVATGPFHTLTLTPVGDDSYEITRDHHPKPYCFTLRDRPVPAVPYRTVTIADYGPDGLFLDRVIVIKVIGGQIHRFDSGAPAPYIESFRDGARRETPITGDPAEAVGRHFHINPHIVRAALAAVTAPRTS